MFCWLLLIAWHSPESNFTHSCLVTPHNNILLGQHWFRLGLGTVTMPERVNSLLSLNHICWSGEPSILILYYVTKPQWVKKICAWGFRCISWVIITSNHCSISIYTLVSSATGSYDWVYRLKVTIMEDKLETESNSLKLSEVIRHH